MADCVRSSKTGNAGFFNHVAYESFDKELANGDVPVFGIPPVLSTDKIDYEKVEECNDSCDK